MEPLKAGRTPSLKKSALSAVRASARISSTSIRLLSSKTWMDRGFKRGIFPFLELAVDESDLSEVGKGLRVTKS